MLRDTREFTFGAAVVLIVPLIIGSGLLLGYIVLRSCNVRVFPRCHFPVVPWDGWHVVRTVCAFVVIHRLMVAAVGCLEQTRATRAALLRIPESVVVALAANAVMAATCLFIIALVAWGGRDALGLLGLREKHKGARAALGVTGLLMVIPLLFAAGILMLILGPLFGIHPRPQLLLADARSIPPAAFAVLCASAILIAPITEEILFRGFLYATLRRYLGPLGAISLTAALFSLLHSYAFGFLSLFLIGFLLGYLYERTGSLVASVAAHAANNLYSLLVVLIVFRSGL